MELRDKIAVVTGGASGIGRGLVQRFNEEGATHVVVVDRDEAGAKSAAEEVGGTGVGVDVSDEAAIQAPVGPVGRDRRPAVTAIPSTGVRAQTPALSRNAAPLTRSSSEASARRLTTVASRLASTASVTYPTTTPPSSFATPSRNCFRA